MSIRTNLVSNPAFERDTLGWEPLGGAIARDTTIKRAGSGSMRATTNGTAALEGVYLYPTSIPWLSPGARASAGAWVLAPAGAAMQLTLTSLGAGAIERFTPFTGTGTWQWVVAEGATVGASQNPYVLVRTATARALTFHVDGVLIEPEAAVGAYADGDSTGWVWEGVAHASRSRGPSGIYTPEAELLRSGTLVDWVDLVPGFEEAATAGTVVQVTADPNRAPYVTVRPGRDARGTLTMHFVRETGKGRPGDRAEAVYRSLSSGSPHTLRMLDVHAGLALLELVPCGVIRRDRQARSDGAWTVEFDFHRVVRPT